MVRTLFISFLLILILSSCRNSDNNFETILPSPDSKKHLYFNLNNGEPYYLFYYENQILIDWSMLGFIIDDTIKFNEGLLVDNVETRTSLHSEKDLFPENLPDLGSFNEITVDLNKVDCDIKLSVNFRIYNNAIAFKYVFIFPGNERKVNEITELDLYNDFFEKAEINYPKQNIINIEEVDTLYIPAAFISDETIKIDYLQSITYDYPGMKLVRRTPDKAEFQMRYTDDFIRNIKMKSGYETPWRIIYVSNNLK